MLSDRPIKGCETYDAYHCDKAYGLFKLHYLKVGMTRLNFEYFIWLDADSVFCRNPDDPLAVMGPSPIHVPLERNLSELTHDLSWASGSAIRARELMRDHGVVDQVYSCSSAFWIIHHDVIDTVYDLALAFWHRAKQSGAVLDVDASLGFAMQMLCADPTAHLLSAHPELWSHEAAVGEATCPEASPDPARSRESFSLTEFFLTKPAIVHWRRRGHHEVTRGPSEKVDHGSVLRRAVAQD